MTDKSKENEETSSNKKEVVETGGEDARYKTWVKKEDVQRISRG